ncbi:MAG: hypothetical protein HY665_01080 [Chloroflexi bacterium]|nr:hypothetical protein [Chloroflexota bacterium]
MAIATSMKELTQDILSSAEERADRLTELNRETEALRRKAAGMVEDFSTSRREASRQLRRQLTQSNADMRKRVMESRDDSRNLIKGFRVSRRDSGSQLRKELAQGRRHLVQNERERKQHVGTLLKDFQSSREETSAQLKNDLAQGKERMKSDVREALAGAEALVNGYQSSRRMTGTQLRNDLCQCRNARKADVAGMSNDFRKVRAELRAELNQASDAWRGMASAIHTGKAGSKTMPKVKAEIPTVEKLLSVISQYVGGITLSEVAKTLGIATIVLGKAARTLQDQGKVRKERNLYFAVSG